MRSERRLRSTRRFTQPMGLLIARYFLVLLAGLLTLLAISWLALGNESFTWPANWASVHIEQIADDLTGMNARDVDNDTIASAYHWHTYDPQGRPLAGDMNDAMRAVADQLISTCLNHDDTSCEPILTAGDPANAATLHYRAVSLADGGWCVLAYDLRSQFVSRQLRDALPNAQTLVVAAMLLSSVLLIATTAMLAGRAVNKRLAALTEAASAVREGRMGFTVCHTDVREVNDVLDSFARMRDALAQSQQRQWQTREAQRRQIGALTHDLKTPLTVIRGNAELLEDTALTHEQQGYAQSIVEGSDRMNGYVQEVLDLTINTAREPMPPAAVSVSQDAMPITAITPTAMEYMDARVFLDRMLKEVTRIAQAAGLHVNDTIRVQRGDATVYIDLPSMTRAIGNIVGNAVTHSPKGVSIDVAAEIGSGQLAITIRDRGPGFDAQALAHATEWLFQADPSRHSTEHHGIGLSTATTIIDAHHGHLTLGNHRSGGATATIQLPLALM